MKVALFNGFPFHYEMFAYVLDYCSNNSIKVDCYTNKVNDLGWFNIFERDYNIKSWYSINSFKPSEYDYVFLLTDDDYSYMPFWNKTTKVIVIEHCGTRILNLPAYKILQTRQFKLRHPPSDPMSWVVPVWNNVLYSKYANLTVLCIGRSAPRRTSELSTLFSNFSNIHFIIINRNLNFTENIPNITTYTSINAENMIEIAAKSHYILLLPNYNTDHENISMSASVPLAYSVGTPLLMTKQFAKGYGFNGIVSMPEKYPFILKMPSEDQIAKCMTGRSELLERRDSVFNSILEIKAKH